MLLHDGQGGQLKGRQWAGRSLDIVMLGRSLPRERPDLKRTLPQRLPSPTTHRTRPIYHTRQRISQNLLPAAASQVLLLALMAPGFSQRWTMGRGDGVSGVWKSYSGTGESPNVEQTFLFSNSVPPIDFLLILTLSSLRFCFESTL